MSNIKNKFLIECLEKANKVFDKVHIECLDKSSEGKDENFMNLIVGIYSIDKEFQFFIGGDDTRCGLSVYTKECSNNCEVALISEKTFEECIQCVKEFKELIIKWREK